MLGLRELKPECTLAEACANLRTFIEREEAKL
jgi:hypothetical protein